MKDLIQDIRQRIHAKPSRVLGILEEMVAINSYSRNYEGINLVGEMFYNALMLEYYEYQTKISNLAAGSN